MCTECELKDLCYSLARLALYIYLFMLISDQLLLKGGPKVGKSQVILKIITIWVSRAIDFSPSTVKEPTDCHRKNFQSSATRDQANRGRKLNARTLKKFWVNTTSMTSMNSFSTSFDPPRTKLQ